MKPSFVLRADGEHIVNPVNFLQRDDEGHKEEQEQKWDRRFLFHELRVRRKELGHAGMKI